MKFPQIKFLIQYFYPRVSVMMLCVCVMGLPISAQTSRDDVPPSESSVAYVQIAGNPSCGTLNSSSNPLFAHITENWELKIDSSTPNGTYPFTNGGDRLLVGPPDGTKSLTVSSANNPSRINSFSSQIPITAVIIKAGSNSYIFPYNPAVSSGTNLNTGDHHAVSHISFCFGVSLTPSAADATVSGRVMDSFGRGISGAKITINNLVTGEMRTILTSTFGYYAVTELESADFYMMTVGHKRYQFADDTRSFTLNEDLVGADFVANP